MRFRRIRPCDPHSIVQITNCVSTKDMILDHFANRQVSLPTGSDSRSFDFPDGKIDWEKSQISEAPDLIEQSFMKDVFAEHLSPAKPPVPPVVPPVDPE